MKDLADIPALMADIGARAKAASAELAYAPAEAKQAALTAAADEVWAARDAIIAANEKDMEFGREKGLSPAMLDRLKLDAARIGSIVEGLRAVAEQADPVGAVLEEWDRPSGLHIRRVRTPLGVVGVIYESRPNVTADAGALCLKAGNAVILRGGSESFHSSGAIHAAMVAGVTSAGLPADAIQLVPTRDRAAVSEMLTMTDFYRRHRAARRQGGWSGWCSARRGCRSLPISRASCMSISTRRPIRSRRSTWCSMPRPGAPASAAPPNVC